MPYIIMDVGYNLTIIEDQATPLAATMKTGENSLFVFGMVIALIGIVVVLGLIIRRRREYQKRIASLCRAHNLDSKQYYSGNKLGRLKESLTDLEQKILGETEVKEAGEKK